MCTTQDVLSCRRLVFEALLKTSKAEGPECHITDDDHFSTEREKGFVCIVSASFLPERQHGCMVKFQQTQTHVYKNICEARKALEFLHKEEFRPLF